LPDAEVQWIKKRIEEHNKKRLDKCESNQQREYYLLCDIAQMLYWIQDDHPSDIHAYVENRLKKDEYSHRLESIITAPKPSPNNQKDNRTVEQREKELNAIVDELKKKHPDLYHELRFKIGFIRDRINSAKFGYTIETHVH
jgi:hypothetical protein